MKRKLAVAHGKTSSTNREKDPVTVQPRQRKGRTTKAETASTEKNKVNEPKPIQVRIILTGIELTSAIRKKIDAIPGAVYEENLEHATHVIAPHHQLKRTDAHAETKWHFELEQTMYGKTVAQRQALLAGYQVYISRHKSIRPPVNDLVKIIECAGGKAVSTGSASPTDLVVTSDAALATASIRKALARANPQQIYTPELILSSVLQQHVQLDKHRLELPCAGRGRSKVKDA
ncbi:hypothetical protein PsorP6_009192 [Peronosclerospora sorghi]|uniref:Uncharacterized protein n=1 Tax=Peronosclerospora sorghi TaxID=230839 RepID=A0ACC0W0D5_9STRA|nr:hypothetical protein PsorP6_009192 [Peronosclerospora sorghi]